MALPEVCVVYLLDVTSDGSRVLIGHKKLGLGAGKRVAPGGKLEPGESPAEAAAREVLEEVGITVVPTDLELIGEIEYVFPHKSSWSQKSWAYRCIRWLGEPTESDELNPEWVDLAKIPYERMWDDAKHWLPVALSGTFVRGHFEFGADNSTVDRWTIEP